MRTKIVSIFVFTILLIITTARAENYAVLNSAAFIRLPSPYESGSQYVHPSVLRFSAPWNGYLFWMAATPYPNGDASKENPVILASKDGLKWELIKIIDETGLLEPYNSDPCLVYDGKRLWIYWRYLGPAQAPQRIFRAASRNGSDWSAKELVLEGERESMCSPSLLILDGKWLLFYSDLDGRIYRRNSTDGLHWENPASQNLRLNSDENFIFTTSKNTHLEVRRTRSGLKMLVMGNSRSFGKNLYLFTASSDSNEWYGNAEPILQVEPGSWDGYSLYKASFLVEESANVNTAKLKLRIWYSAYRMNPVAFHIGYTETLLEQWRFDYNQETSPWRSLGSGMSFNGYPNHFGTALLEKRMRNGSVQAGFRFQNGVTDAGLVFRYQDSEHFAAFRIVNNQAKLQVNNAGKNELRIMELTNAFPNDAPLTLKLSVTNQVYQAFINNRPVMKLIAKEELGYGYSGVFGSGCNFQFQDFIAR